jgi:hypothetical protein
MKPEHKQHALSNIDNKHAKELNLSAQIVLIKMF